MTPLATVVIPVRDAARDIAECLRHVAAQDVGAHRLEVVVADGCSTDGTRAIAERRGASAGFGRFVVVDNPSRGISSGLNRALAVATAPLTIRVDARSRIQPQYASRVIELLEARGEIGVVGGAQVPVAATQRPLAAAIARALSNRYATGLSRYRRSTRSGPSDTVWMGAFRTDELRALGGWNEQLPVNEDYELCERYLGAGYTVWFEAGLRSGYVPRDRAGEVLGQHFRYGREKGRRWAGGATIAPRQRALLIAPPLAALAGVALGRRIGAAPAAVVLAGALVLIDHLGAESGPASLRVRLAATASMPAIGGAWWLGAIGGWTGAAGPGVAGQTGGAGRRPPSCRSEKRSAAQ